MRSLKIVSFFVSSAMLPLGCVNPLVNEDYATTSRESINGLDLFEEMLAAKGTTTHSVFVDPAKLKDADLVVYFPRNPSPESAEIQNIKRALDSAVERPKDGNVAGHVAGPVKNVSLLILQRGLTASPAFWSRLFRAFPDVQRHERIRSFIRQQLEKGEILSRLSGSGFFFSRLLVDRVNGDGTVPVEYNLIDRVAFLLEPGRLPGRIPVGLKISLEELEGNEDDPHYERTIIGLENGAFFSEASLSGAHLFLISDATPFLNFHLARTEYRTLLNFILDRSLRHAIAGDRPKILILSGWNTKEEEMEKERSLLSIFFRPPWNIPVALLLILFVLFVWSRLMRERPATEFRIEDRDGDLLRHFRGVAELLNAARRRK